MNSTIIKPMPEDLAREIRDTPRSKYYNNLPLHPSDDLHNELLQLGLECIRQGRAVIDRYVDRWDLLDWARDAYMPADQVDRRIKQKDIRKPICPQLPVMHAEIEWFQAQYHLLFCQPDGMHRFKGGGEDMSSAAKMEMVVNRQTSWFKEPRVFDLVVADCFTYGVGAAHLKWSKLMRPDIDKEYVDETLHGMLKGVPGAEKGKMVRWISDKLTIAREGTEWVHINPYQLILDPNATPDTIYESDFFGWMRRTRASTAIALEKDPEEARINSAALRLLSVKGGGESVYYRDQSRRREGTDNGFGRAETKPFTSWVDEAVLFLQLVPSERKLGDSHKPCWYQMTIAGDRLITQFEKCRGKSGLPPFVFTAPNARGSQIVPCSHMMTVYPLHEASAWKLKAHIDNQRGMNNRFIIHQKYLNYKDFKNSESGPMVVRTTEDAMASDMPLDKLYHQIQTQDLSADVWKEIASMTQIRREGLGNQELLQGAGGGLPERPTAAGINTLRQGGQSRPLFLATVIDSQMMQPAGYQMAWNTLQYMSQPVVAEILGRWKEVLEAEYGVGKPTATIFPGDLDPNFDMVPFTEGFPLGDDSGMDEFVKTAAAQPGVLPLIVGDEDLKRVFRHYWRKKGIDMPSFANPTGSIPTGAPQYVDNEQLQQQAQAGNVVPMRQVPQEAFAQ